MSRYSDEERQNISNKVRETLARGEAASVQDDARKQREVELEYLEGVGNAELAEAMSAPVEDRVAKWKREADEMSAAEQRETRERRRRERRAEPVAVDWDLRIAEVAADERQRVFDLLTETIAELTERQHEEIDAATKPLQLELAELKLANAEANAFVETWRTFKTEMIELKAMLNQMQQILAGADRSGTIDLPQLPLRSHRSN